MSPVLELELDPGPIARARADVVVVALFEGERPLRGSAGQADWRLCGRLSQLVASGRLRGARGEAALVPTGGALRAPLLIAVGLGELRSFDARAQEEFAADAVRRACELEARVLALPFAVGGLDERTLRGRAGGLLAGAGRALAGARVGALRLRLATAAPQLPRAEAALRGARPRLPAGVALRLPESPPPGRLPSARATY